MSLYELLCTQCSYIPTPQFRVGSPSLKEDDIFIAPCSSFHYHDSLTVWWKRITSLVILVFHHIQSQISIIDKIDLSLCVNQFIWPSQLNINKCIIWNTYNLLYYNCSFSESSYTERSTVSQRRSTETTSTVLTSFSEIGEGDRRRPSNGIMVTRSKGRRTSSPDRHIRFKLNTEQKDTTETIRHGQPPTDVHGVKAQREEKRYNRPEFRTRGYVDRVPFTNSVHRNYFEPDDDNVFELPKKTRNTSNQGYDNMAYDDTSADSQRNLYSGKINTRSSVRKQDPYTDAPGYDSSQTSTLDSVFTERSWQSDRGRPTKFREKRRVYPKPKDPVGDIGDGLKTKLSNGHRRDHRRVPQQYLTAEGHVARRTTDKLDYQKRKRKVSNQEPSQELPMTSKADIRKSLIRRELQLFVRRELTKESFRTSGRYYLQGDPRFSSRNAKDHHLHGNRRPSEDNIKGGYHHSHAAGQLRNQTTRAKHVRPITYPNNLNEPHTGINYPRRAGDDRPNRHVSTDEFKWEDIGMSVNPVDPTHAMNFGER